ncbi:MAG: hypothetical protein U0521_01590 [Anaerolineae bacterium]
MPRPLHIANAHIYTGHDYAQRDLYTTDVVVAGRPTNALTVDLSGYTIFPGLINAHDHLELNHYPRTKYRERYDNASQWSADVNSHLNESPFKELRAYPLEDRCFIGGLKNLLCGATTVVHHNPPHKCLFKRDFPVRVLKNYGWAHSLYLSSDEEIVASYRSTPPDVPWFIHLAEGTDEAAAGEYRRLKALGCVGSNTVMVHGVGLSLEDVYDAISMRAKLVLCPTTNLYLLDTTVAYYQVSNALLGSDSRLTADGDLLDELRALVALFPDQVRSLWFLLRDIEKPLTHSWGWDTIDLKAPGAHADLIALKHDYETDLPDSLVINARRADLALIVRGGEPQIGDPDMMAKFPHIETVAARLDDKEKSINVSLARQIARCTLKKRGLELLQDPFARRWRAFQRG